MELCKPIITLDMISDRIEGHTGFQEHRRGPSKLDLESQGYWVESQMLYWVWMGCIKSEVWEHRWEKWSFRQREDYSVIASDIHFIFLNLFIYGDRKEGREKIRKKIKFNMECHSSCSPRLCFCDVQCSPAQGSHNWVSHSWRKRGNFTAIKTSHRHVLASHQASATQNCFGYMWFYKRSVELKPL